MFLDVIRSPGLAHLSYVLGDGGQAAVIDPRLDVEEYLRSAGARDARITLVLETHRNEDVVSGARALAEATGARALHGTALEFAYGEGVADGHEERLGALRLRVLHTPGHTDESISVAYFDTGYPDGAVGVFTGDALFVGDVGRTDFYPGRAEQVAAALYDSIFEKLLPLGDQALLHPAHGAGSVCGDDMASRERSSLGHERRNNPRLQLSRAEFVAAKVAEHHDQPPYFRRMEETNQRGAPRLAPLPEPLPATPEELERAMSDGLVLVDVRSPEACAGAAVPGSIALPLGTLSGYAGWLLSYDRPLGLVAERPEDVAEAILRLARMGYTRIERRLAGGLGAWATSGRPLQTVPAVSAADVRARLERDEPFTLLDVRSRPEYEEKHLPGAHHRFLGELPSDDGAADLRAPIVTFCSSGKRAIVAASLLRRAGVRDVAFCLGSMEACEAIGCPVETGG